MSEYKGIKGFQVQTRTEDPSEYAQQHWKIILMQEHGHLVVTLNTAIDYQEDSAGIQTAGMIMGNNPGTGTDCS